MWPSQWLRLTATILRGAPCLSHFMVTKVKHNKSNSMTSESFVIYIQIKLFVTCYRVCLFPWVRSEGKAQNTSERNDKEAHAKYESWGSIAMICKGVKIIKTPFSENFHKCEAWRAAPGGPRFKVSSEGLSTEIDIPQRSPIQVQTKIEVA